jgi:hypothetical protein
MKAQVDGDRLAGVKVKGSAVTCGIALVASHDDAYCIPGVLDVSCFFLLKSPSPSRISWPSILACQALNLTEYLYTTDVFRRGCRG